MNSPDFVFDEENLPQSPDGISLTPPRGTVVPGGSATPGSPVAAAAAASSYPLDDSSVHPSPSREELEGFYRGLSKKPIKRELFKRKRKGQSNDAGRKKKYTDNQIKKILRENNIYYRSSVSLDDGVYDPIVIIKERFGGNPYEYIKSLYPSEQESMYDFFLDADKGGKRRRKKRTKKRSRKKKRKTLKKKRKRRKKKRKTRR